MHAVPTSHKETAGVEELGYSNVICSLVFAITQALMPVPPSNTPGQLSGSISLRKEKENKMKHNQKKNSTKLLGSKSVWYFSSCFFP